MKKYLSRAPFTKDKVARRELAFAHTIIVMLSLSLLAVINLLDTDFIAEYAALVATVDVLLVLTMAISLAIVFAILRKR
jgi:hypothetical protein